MLPLAHKMLRSSIAKGISALKSRLGAPDKSARRLAPEVKSNIRERVKIATSAIKMSKLRRKRFADQLRTDLRHLVPADPAEPPTAPAAAASPQRCRKQHDAKVPSDPMRWELTAAISQSSHVALDGPPVHLNYRQRRSPSGFRDAASFLRRRRLEIRDRPQEVKVLAPRQRVGAAANPIAHTWRDVTKSPRDACVEGGYVKVYYGGKAAMRMQTRGSARLPSNLRLRGHKRALMFFVSVSDSNSTTHYDDTPSVLYCLCGERTVWLAPPEAKHKLGLRARPRYPRFLEYDPSACEAPDSVWKCVVLHAGQGVFIPRGWWHTVRATAGSLAISLEVRE